jgi:hypothetical protein
VAGAAFGLEVAFEVGIADADASTGALVVDASVPVALATEDGTGALVVDSGAGFEGLRRNPGSERRFGIDATPGSGGRG